LNEPILEMSEEPGSFKEGSILSQSDSNIFSKSSKGMVKVAVSLFNAAASETSPASSPVAAKPTCSVCREPVGPSGIAKGPKYWCASHFKCSVCNVALSAENGRYERGRVVCKDHMERLCASCRLPVIGHAINAFDQTWHPHHFKASLWLAIRILGSVSANC
jgi:hypothetical protein